MALPKQDTFTNSNGVQLADHNAGWNVHLGDMDIQSDALAGDSADEAVAGWEADTFDNDQYAQIRSAALTSTNLFMGPAIRVQEAGVGYYGFYSDGNERFFFEYDGDTWDQKGTTDEWSINDIARLEAEGDTITPLLNEIEDSGVGGAITDSTYATGNAGVCSYKDGPDTRIDDFEGGNLRAVVTMYQTTAIDAVLQEVGLTVTSTLDALLQKIGLTETLSLDSLLQDVGVEVDSSIDAILKAFGLTETASLDALLIKIGFTETVSLDALLQDTGLTVTSTFDALLHKIGLTETTVIDALLNRVGLTVTTSIDAVLKETGLTVTASLDAILFALGGFAFGEESPNQDENPESWATWSDGGAGLPTITGDADWGKLSLGDGEIGHSLVKNTGDTDNKLITVTRDRYGSGSGNVNIYIRGQAGSFGQDDGSPSWEAYSTPVAKVWQYVQLKVEYSD
jgi:antitoxin component of RelBE/YafQ-DinJ toxin-antitoxin module